MIILIKPALLTVGLLFTPMLVAEPLTQNQLHATMGIVTNFILSDDIGFHGKSYSPIISPHTGRVWLDRNIGASKKCTSYDDASCYGDYFQWGRKHDGHESSVDSTTVRASDINNAGAEFIRGSTDWASTDLSYGNSRATNWLKTDGSTVCPVGYRVPLRSELEAEVGNIINTGTAYTNFLKLPATGYRDYYDANDVVIGIVGTVWSVTATLNGASYFSFHTGSSQWVSDDVRAYGFSVRCIKHVGKVLIYHNTTTYANVTSPYTGKVWLDRNLGAAKVCTSFNDTACYGDYYQWGRNFDGHEDFTSGESTVLATNITTVGEPVFIKNGSSPYDWASVDGGGNARMDQWAQTDGGSICPVNYRVATLDELKAEMTAVSNKEDAFSNFLKLPSQGFRSGSNGVLLGVGIYGSLWSATLDINGAGYINYDNNTGEGYGRFSSGAGVRCVKN